MGVLSKQHLKGRAMSRAGVENVAEVRSSSVQSREFTGARGDTRTLNPDPALLT